MAEGKHLRGGVRYENVDPEYLAQRSLRKGAGWKLLWAMGVGAVISGYFSGWNTGLSVGGFGGLAIATILMTVMYVCMVYSIAELSAALPHAGGFYSFARNAFGPWGGMIVGISDTIEYVLTPAVVVYYIGGALSTILPDVPPWIWWVGFYTVFVGINVLGVSLTFKAGLVVTLLAMLVLAVFYVSAVTSGVFNPDLLLNVPADPGNSAFLPKGVYGIFAAIPFAIWFYLAIEQLPLAAEETVDAEKNMPKALIYGILTLILLTVLTLVINSGVGGGAVAIGPSTAPLPDGFQAIFGKGVTTVILTLIAVTGLVASLHTIIYAAGRVLFALSRSGYYPRWLSVTGARTRTPHRALVASAIIGLVVAWILQFNTDSKIGAALLSMAVFGAVISYTMVMLAFIRLRIAQPNLRRPYRSPLGIPGAAIGTVLSFLALIATPAVEANRPGVYGTAIFFAVMLIYFAVYSSKKLVAQSPEEEVALVRKSEAELA